MQNNAPDESQKLTTAEVADLEARQDGSLPAKARRALRHGAGDLARAAEALAQSQFFDALAKAAVHRRALLHSGGGSADETDSGSDLMSYRSEGLLWQARIRG